MADHPRKGPCWAKIMNYKTYLKFHLFPYFFGLSLDKKQSNAYIISGQGKTQKNKEKEMRTIRRIKKDESLEIGMTVSKRDRFFIVKGFDFDNEAVILRSCAMTCKGARMFDNAPEEKFKMNNITKIVEV